MHKFCCLLVFTVLLASCNDNTVKSSFTSLPGGNWAIDNTVSFEFSELDTLAKHNMFIHIRNDETFEYSNLFLIAELDFPSGETVKDTLEYEMAAADGTWLGKGYGSLKENKLWYKENIVFPNHGVYKLKLSHAMRKNGSETGVIELKGITDVGYQIEIGN